MTKLELYNLALSHLGEPALASLSEERGPRRALDAQYDHAVGFCLERGLWNFAMRVIEITASEDVTPSFGYTNAFEKPSDWVRTHVIADHENFDPPLLRVLDEAGIWYADCDPLYVQYVSNGASYGANLSLWPSTFTDYVALRLARTINLGITSSESKQERLEKAEKKAGQTARASDAMNQPPGFAPLGTWVVSRGAGRTRQSRWDGTGSTS